ncbi:MAG TPA: hypothetical protein VN042_00665 [Asticcacaulis sp.]|nr:hypothetical protein [Asticcacaulis sp.]
MESIETGREELTPLEARRARLRALADKLLDTLEGLDAPETHLEADRAAKAYISADRMFTLLFQDAGRRTLGGGIKYAPDYAPGAADRVSTPRSAVREEVRNPSTASRSPSPLGGEESLAPSALPVDEPEADEIDEDDEYEGLDELLPLDDIMREVEAKTGEKLFETEGLTWRSLMTQLEAGQFPP